MDKENSGYCLACVHIHRLNNQYPCNVCAPNREYYHEYMPEGIKSLLENSKPLEPEFEKVIEDNFWELIDKKEVDDDTE